MINQYIRDHKLKTLWDITQPHIRSHHERLMREWIEMAQAYRDSIHRGVKHEGRSIHQWLNQNYDQVQLTQLDSDYTKFNPCWDCEIMDAYLEWGVRNYPISDRVTEHTLTQLERVHQGKEMLWGELIRDVMQIIQYQTDRNQKPFEKMTREELLRWMQSQPEYTVRRAVTAVTR